MTATVSIERLIGHTEQVGEVARGPEITPLPFELFGDIRPQLGHRWLVKSLLRTAALSVIFGLPGAGKSFFILDVGLHVAAGRDWQGRQVRQGGVVYLAAEGQSGLRTRIEAWRRAYNYTDRRIPFALIPASVDLLTPKADLDSLAQTLKELAQLWGGIDLLVVDTLPATFGGGDENGSDMAVYVANIARISSPYDCATAILTHPPLAEGAKRPRGHGSLWGSADTAIQIVAEEGAKFRRINVVKQKDDDPGPDILFTLRPVDIGADEYGELVTSCIVEAFEKLDPPASRVAGKPLSPTKRIAIDALRKLVDRSGLPPPLEIPSDSLDRALVRNVADLSEWLSEVTAALLKSDNSPDSGRRAAERARDALKAAKIIGIWNDYVWLN